MNTIHRNIYNIHIHTHIHSLHINEQSTPYRFNNVHIHRGAYIYLKETLIYTSTYKNMLIATQTHAHTHTPHIHTKVEAHFTHHNRYYLKIYFT